MNPTNPRNLLEEWLVGIKVRVLSHYDMAKWFESMNLRLSVPAAVFSAIAGVINTADQTQYPWSQTLATSVMILVSIMSALQGVLHFSELAAKHKDVAVKFSVMRRDIEVTLAVSETVAPDVLNGVKTQWNELDAASPSIPHKTYARHHKYLCADCEEPGAHENMATK